MIQRFRDKTGGTYSNSVLNTKVFNSPQMTNFLKTFGKRLNTELQNASGVINNISVIIMGQIKPIFGGKYNMAFGLQILVHDAEYHPVTALILYIKLREKLYYNAATGLLQGLQMSDFLPFQVYIAIAAIKSFIR